MTVASAENIEQFTGDDTAGPFSPSYLILDEDHIEVYVDDTLQTKTTHYTVANVGPPAGFDVTFEAGSEPSSGSTVTIQRVVPFTQETDYLENDPFPAQTHENALDLLTMLAQQLDRRVKRSITTPVADDPDLDMSLPDKSTRADTLLAFDSAGLPVARTVGSVADNVDTQFDSAQNNDLIKHDGSKLINISRDAMADLIIPAGTIWEYSGASLPDEDEHGKWLWPDGSTIGDVGSGADTEGSDLKPLFDAIKRGHGNAGTENFANGDTVKLPDRRGRVSAGKDDMGGTTANRLTSGSKAGIDGTTLGDSGGSEEHALTEAELPQIDIDDLMNFNDPNHDHGGTAGSFGTGYEPGGLGPPARNNQSPSSSTGITISFDTFGSDEAHTNVQPTYVNNFIIKR